MTGFIECRNNVRGLVRLNVRMQRQLMRIPEVTKKLIKLCLVGSSGDKAHLFLHWTCANYIADMDHSHG